MKPIFSDNILSHYLSDFTLSLIPNIRKIELKISEWTIELKTGRIDSCKEESIKSRFLLSFFGDILGFNYGNATEWMLEEERKSTMDGTKVDGALGYFTKIFDEGKVRALIEVKDSKHNLDEEQKRTNDKRTPVQQAFEYAPKMGGECKWVIVTNIKEIRFYSAGDQSKYQVFFLKDLVNETKLKELLFLFHKDRLIKKKDKAQTDLLLEKSGILFGKPDKSIHIIDKIYNCLIRFEGFGFVDPCYIVTLYPFNILNEHVWQYHNRNLFTINGNIFELLNEIDIENDEVVFSDQLINDIETANVIDAKTKLETAFKFLNHCQINQITAIKDFKKVEERNKSTIGFSCRHSFSFKEGEEGITKSIYLLKNKQCDCLSCNYRSLNFNIFLGKLKTGFGNEDLNISEYAYGNYLAASNNFKTAYNIYKAIEKETKGKEGKEIEYFLTKQNIKYLHNLILDYQYDDSKEILNDIKSVDLDKVIYDEIEFCVDKDVKNYLIDVKENKLVYKLQDEIEEITFQIEKLKGLYDNGGDQLAGPNLPSDLFHAYYLLYLHVNTNYIVYDAFKRYKSLIEKVFKGLVTSYLTKEIGVNKFYEFFLTEAILHISPKDLQELLKGVDYLKTDRECVEKLIEKLNNFTTSYFNDGLFNNPYVNSLLKEHLTNFRFRDAFTNIFSNLFTILSRLEITKELFSNSRKPLLKYLKIESDLSWSDLKQFSYFLLRKGSLFEADELMEVLKIAVEGDRYGYSKYTNLIDTTAKAINKFYPRYMIDNVKLIETAILKCRSEDGNYANLKQLSHLVMICNDNCKQILLNTFEIELEKKFDIDLYETLLEKTDYNYDTKNYFQIYTEQINRTKGGSAYKFGKKELTDLVFINYAFILYKLNIDFGRIELKSFTNLNGFETWLLNPYEFEYNNFDPKWLTDLDNPIFLNRLKDNEKIKTSIELELKNSFEPVLAQIKYSYFV